MEETFSHFPTQNCLRHLFDGCLSCFPDQNVKKKNRKKRKERNQTEKRRGLTWRVASFASPPTVITQSRVPPAPFFHSSIAQLATGRITYPKQAGLRCVFPSDLAVSSSVFVGEKERIL